MLWLIAFAGKRVKLGRAGWGKKGALVRIAVRRSWRSWSKWRVALCRTCCLAVCSLSTSWCHKLVQLLIYVRSKYSTLNFFRTQGYRRWRWQRSGSESMTVVGPRSLSVLTSETKWSHTQNLRIIQFLLVPLFWCFCSMIQKPAVAQKTDIFEPMGT